jgi:hypothetical protein
LREGFEGLEVEADDPGGEAEFGFGLWAIGVEDGRGGVSRGFHVSMGALKEKQGDLVEDCFEEGFGEVGEGHGWAWVVEGVCL